MKACTTALCPIALCAMCTVALVQEGGRGPKTLDVGYSTNLFYGVNVSDTLASTMVKLNPRNKWTDLWSSTTRSKRCSRRSEWAETS